MNISYDYYKTFYYVAKYHSFSKAADALYASQPNITRTVKNLESALGCTLLVRSNRSVSLTPEGERLFRHVKIAVEHIQAGEEELSLENSLRSGAVSIGATENTLHYVLLPLLKTFREHYPGVNIKVTNHSTVQAVNALKNGLVDFAIVTSPVRLPASLKAVTVRTFHEAAVCSSAFLRPTEGNITLKELTGYPLICLGADTMTFEFYSQFFYENGAVLSPQIEVDTTDQILSMVNHDLGIGFVPEYFIRSPSVRKNLTLLKLTPEIPERTICLIKRTDQPLSIAAKTLEKMIVQSSEN